MFSLPEKMGVFVETGQGTAISPHVAKFELLCLLSKDCQFPLSFYPSHYASARLLDSRAPPQPTNLHGLHWCHISCHRCDLAIKCVPSAHSFTSPNLFSSSRISRNHYQHCVITSTASHIYIACDGVKSAALTIGCFHWDNFAPHFIVKSCLVRAESKHCEDLHDTL